MISLKNLGDKKLASMLAGMPDSLQKEVARAVGEQTMSVLKRAKQMVSGEVLKRRTGTLRRKINARIDRLPGGVIGTVGIKLTYAAVHEFGFKGQVDVRAHERRIYNSFKKAKENAKGRIMGAKAREVKSLAYVKAHTRQVNFPERSFLRAALEELKPGIIAAIRAAVAKGVK